MKKYVNNSFITKSPSEYKNGTAAVTNLPVTIYTDGQPVSSYTIKGNTVQSGTPTPSNPVTISGVGEETANLFNIADLDAKDSSAINNSGVEVSSDFTGYTLNYIDCKPDTDYTIYNTEIARNGGYYRLYFYDISKNFISRSDSYVFMSKPLLWQLRSPANAYYFQIQYGYTSAVQSWEYLMVLEGLSVPDHYIPYGKYEISILKGLTALTPIYLSQQLLKVGDYTDDVNSSGTATYNIAKYEFTGTERVQKNYSEDPTSYLYYTSMTIAADEVICTQLPYGSSIPKTDVGITGRANNNILYLNFGADVMNAQTSGNTANGLKEYLAAQYAAGTPVTVYYVLATPTTESVTVPEITTTGGEVSIDVDTTVKPSEIDLTYHGWHEHQPLKRENGAWE